MTTLSVSKLYSVGLNERNSSAIVGGRIMKGEFGIRPTRKEIVSVPPCTPKIPQTPYNWREIFVADSGALGTGFSQGYLNFALSLFSH